MYMYSYARLHAHTWTHMLTNMHFYATHGYINSLSSWHAHVNFYSTKFYSSHTNTSAKQIQYSVWPLRFPGANYF